MSQQLTINFEAKRLARRGDPKSSKAAAERMVESGAILSHEEIILNLLDLYPGSTAKELAKHCDLDNVKILRRTKAMEEKKGLIRGDRTGPGEIRWYKL